MKLNSLLSLIPGASRRRSTDNPHSVTNALAEFSDHHLRDIGYVRERNVAPHRHILWM